MKIKDYFKFLSIILSSIFYVNVGIKHFTDPQWFLQIMPPYLPFHIELVYISGLFEILLGILLLFNFTRYHACMGLILLLVLVFPANIYLAQTNGKAMDISPIIAWGRLPFQIVFIGIAYLQRDYVFIFNKKYDIGLSSFWNDKYIDEKTKWDIGGPTPILTNYLQNKKTNIGKVCVLGCGNGHDVIELSRYNNEVYAVDFSKQAIQNLENKISDSNLMIKLINEDIFNLDQNYLNSFDMVFEYTCYCAIHPNQRKRYFDLVHKILKKDGILYGIFIPFDKKTNDGPPFKVNLNEIKNYTTDKFDIIKNYMSDLSIPQRRNRERVIILKKIA